MKVSERDRYRVCPHCGLVFYAKRADKVFCDADCSKWYRESKRYAGTPSYTVATDAQLAAAGITLPKIKRKKPLSIAAIERLREEYNRTHDEQLTYGLFVEMMERESTP